MSQKDGGLFYVYILASENNRTLYIGVTNDIVRRISEHKSGMIEGFTKRYGVDKLVYFETCSDAYSAIMREKQLKKWRREKKIQLINSINPFWKDFAAEITKETIIGDPSGTSE